MIKDITHSIFDRPLTILPPDGMESILFAMGCFWGAERLFWEKENVYLTAVGYSGGEIVNPSYEQVCTGNTGHAEVVSVIFDPSIVSLETLLTIFWEGHNPTQGMRQGNDIGSQYRSAIYTCSPQQHKIAQQTKLQYQAKLTAAGLAQITTEIRPAETFYFAESYHQQYLAKNPNGYCGLGGTGVLLAG